MVDIPDGLVVAICNRTPALFDEVTWRVNQAGTSYASQVDGLWVPVLVGWRLAVWSPCGGAYQAAVLHMAQLF